MDQDLLTKLGLGVGSVGAAIYAAFRMFKKDRMDDKAAERSDQAAEAANNAMMQVITTLREEVDRLTKRLEAVEEQNRKCEERNDAMHAEILELKQQLHLA
jgi:uncharacterized membrane protein